MISSLHHLRHLESALPVGTFAVQLASRVVTWSPGFRRLMGFAPGAKPGVDPFMEAVHPDDQWIVDELLTLGSSPLRRYRVRLPSGETRWQACSVDTLSEADGRPAVLLGVVADVTDEQGAGERLHRQHALFERMAELSGCLTWRASPAGLAIRSRAWLSFTGQGYDEALLDGWTARLHPADAPAAERAWREALRTSEGFALPLRVRRVDGADLPFTVHVSPVRGAGGAVVEWLGCAVPAAAAGAPPPAERAAASPSPSELRGCRGLLDWTVTELAARSGVSPATIARYEAASEAGVVIRPATLAKLRAACEHAGLRFLKAPDGAVSIGRTATATP